MGTRTWRVYCDWKAVYLSHLADYLFVFIMRRGMENNVTKIVSDCIYSPELLAKNGSLNYCISCNFFNNHFSLQNFNAPKFYPVSFAIRNFFNHKYDWCKSKKMHILPIFANFVTNAKKNPLYIHDKQDNWLSPVRALKMYIRHQRTDKLGQIDLYVIWKTSIIQLLRILYANRMSKLLRWYIKKKVLRKLKHMV